MWPYSVCKNQCSWLQQPCVTNDQSLFTDQVKAPTFCCFQHYFLPGTFSLYISQIGKHTFEFATSHRETSTPFTAVCRTLWRLCGRGSGIRRMWQVSPSEGSMTVVISEVADMPRHPSTRTLSKAGFSGGTAPAGNSLSSTEIGLCSELHVLVFKSQIAYGGSKFPLQAPSYFQHC